MITATYRYYVDWNGDGDFSDSNENISAFVFEASWEYGRDYASQLSGRSKAGSCRISLDNSDSRFVPWADVSDDDWAHGLANKLMRQVNVVRFGAMFVRDGGSITLTTGVLAQHPMAGGSIVTMVNSAVEGFVRAASVELGSRVRVNAVSPGWVAETMQAMGMDPSAGLPAARVAEYFVQQIENGAQDSIVIASGRVKMPSRSSQNPPGILSFRSNGGGQGEHVIGSVSAAPALRMKIPWRNRQRLLLETIRAGSREQADSTR